MWSVIFSTLLEVKNDLKINFVFKRILTKESLHSFNISWKIHAKLISHVLIISHHREHPTVTVLLHYWVYSFVKQIIIVNPHLTR